nr:MAG TPA: intron associated endonuclease [Bacteriophage sp.]
MTCGIYKITNKINGHSYIGLSKNIEHRFADHRTKPFQSKRKDDQEKVLYKAIRKYGLDNFSFEIVEECPESQLCDRECFWIDYYGTYRNREDYNETPGGDIVGDKMIHLGQEHGMAKLTDEDVIYCRKCYAEGKRSRQVWEEKFSNVIPYAGFLKMWHGQTWKHMMPEVFEHNPHPRVAYTAQYRDEVVSEWKKTKLTMSKYVKTGMCPVGYGTLWKMVNEPEFYDGK